MQSNGKRFDGDVSSALSKGTLFFDGFKSLIITEEFDQISDLIAIYRLMRTLAESDETLFSCAQNKHIDLKMFHATPTGERLWQLINIDIQGIRRHFQHYLLNRYCRTFFAAVRHFNLKSYFSLIKLRRPISKEHEAFISALNSAVQTLRCRFASESFNKKNKNFNRNSNKNTVSLSNFLEAKIKSVDEIFVISIDLGYKNENRIRQNIKTSLTPADVQKHRKHFLLWLGKAIPKGVLHGYAWKLEYSLKKGFQYYMIILLTGADVGECHRISSQIEDQWRLVTDGKGVPYTYANPMVEQLNSGKFINGMLSSKDKKVMMRLYQGCFSSMIQPAYLLKLNVHGLKEFRTSNK